jgi:hypothetical protein
VISLYGVNGLFFWDAKTVPCGLLSFIDTGDPNRYLNPDYPGACGGFGYEYMVPPAATQLLAGLVRVAGTSWMTVGYALAYAAALSVLLRSTRRYSDNWPEVAAAASLMACGVYLFEAGGGNLTIAFLGGLLALLPRLDRGPRGSLAVVVLCVVGAWIKPMLALYLLIPLYAAGAWLAVAAGAAAATTLYALDAVLQPVAFDRWLQLIVPIVYDEPHFGVVRLMQAFGLGAGDWGIQMAAYALWCALILTLLWRLRARLPRVDDKAMAALLVVTLLQPRFKEYDAVVLIPLLFWLRARLPTVQRVWLERGIVLGTFVVPALWWWGRKLRLTLGVDHPTLTQWADPRWMIETQGFFLTLASLILFAFLILIPREARDP